MNTQQFTNRNRFYTRDHEWIDFEGSVAYCGVCTFKLNGITTIDKLVFSATSGFKQQGEVLATIKYEDFLIPIHMPVSGKILKINEELINDKTHNLLLNAEGSDWLVLISPAQPYDRNFLLLPLKYRMSLNTKVR
jgi:glycine cleavage system H protein